MPSVIISDFLVGGVRALKTLLLLQLINSLNIYFFAPVAQWIEHRPPEAGAQVRFPPGAQIT